MIEEALVAWLHYLSVFALAASIAAELALYRREMSAQAQTILRRVDLGYGLAAILVLATGLVRVFWLGKGASYYAQNGFFWALVVLFAAVGLLSIPPTIHYLRWKGEAPITVDARRFRHVRLHLILEAALFPLLPLCAVLMARGYG